MLAQYHRWIFENHRWESVETLKEFASETIRGVTSSNRSVDSRRNRSEKAFFGNAQESEIQKYRPCKVCKGRHGVWRCDKFKDLPVQERWNTAKRLKLCFRCLGGDHRGKTLVRTRTISSRSKTTGWNWTNNRQERGSSRHIEPSKWNETWKWESAMGSFTSAGA